MPVQIASNTMPDTIANLGPLYNWRRPRVVGRNGRGLDVVVGYPALEWGWTWLIDSDWDWWVTTILSGQQSALISSGTTQLYDQDKVLKTITSCVVHAPEHQTIRNGLHYNVRILIDQIVLA